MTGRFEGIAEQRKIRVAFTENGDIEAAIWDHARSITRSVVIDPIKGELRSHQNAAPGSDWFQRLIREARIHIIK